MTAAGLWKNAQAPAVFEEWERIQKTFPKTLSLLTRQGREGEEITLSVESNAELVQKTLDEVQHLFLKNLPKIAKDLVDLATDNSIDPKHQIKAAEIVINRVMGKAPERIEIKGARRWEKALTASIVGSDDDIIDVEVIDDTTPVKKKTATVTDITKVKKKKKSKKKE